MSAAAAAVVKVARPRGVNFAAVGPLQDIESVREELLAALLDRWSDAIAGGHDAAVSHLSWCMVLMAPGDDAQARRLVAVLDGRGGRP